MYCPRCATQVPDGDQTCPSCGIDLSAISSIAGSQQSAGSARRPKDLEAVQQALNRDFEVIEELGRGGMAVVYRAIDRSLEREVALKVLPAAMTYDDEYVARFEREAKTAAQLEHPHIIPIHRVGREGNVIYFAMKFLRGRSLGQILDDSGPLPPDEIRRIIAECAEALGYAHQRGVVHRDVKPDNVVFDEGGRTVVTDFGIAKAASGTKLTGTGMAIGTPFYMSPEQARAQDLDGRSDIYSLGVVAYQCLTGTVPFTGDDSFAVGLKHISEELPVPELKSEEQRSLYQIIRKMMEKSPDDRFQDTTELVNALRGLATSGETVAMPASNPAVPGVPKAARSSQPTPATPMPTASPPTKGRTTNRPVAVAAVIGLIVVGGAGWAIMNMSGSGPSDPIASSDGAEEAAMAPDSEATDTVTDGSEAAVASVGAAEPASSSAGVASSVSSQPTQPAEPASSPQSTETAVAPSPEPPPRSRPTPADRWRAASRQRLQSLFPRLQREGYEVVGRPVFGQLSDDAEASTEVVLEPGWEYMLAGFCDDDCSDLDLTLANRNGEQIASDLGVDAPPVITWRPLYNGPHTVTARMYECSSDACFYTLTVLRKQPTGRLKDRDTRNN